VANKKLDYTTRHVSEIQERGGTAVCDSLMAESIDDNGYHGVMFDMHVINTINLETFSMYLNPSAPGVLWVGIFYRQGTYVGNETSSTGWIMLDSAQMDLQVSGIAKIPLDLNLVLQANTDYAFYVTTINNTGDNNYKDGTSVGNIVNADANIQIKEGAGGAYPFDVTNFPRVLVGQAFYCTVPTGIEENNMNENITMMPNPVNDILNIGGKSKVDQIEITDISGRLIFQNNNTRSIDCSDFENGVYFLKIYTAGNQITKKFIKEQH
jgi:hypothetical protein